ncbi:MAG: hypothetical protein ACAI35_03445 [Candidatus Methylacidiphilales bacterium]
MIRWQTRLQESIVEEKLKLSTHRRWVAEAPKWAERDKWMSTRLEVLGDNNVAEAALNSEIGEKAQQFGAQIVEQGALTEADFAIRADPKTVLTAEESTRSSPWARILFSVKVKTSLENATRMAAALHRPDKFQTVSGLLLTPEETGLVTCTMIVIRWYRAPETASPR